MNITVLLVSWSFGILAIFSFLRFIMQLSQVNFYNSIVQFVCRVTDVYCEPLRKLLPYTNNVDIASLIITVLIYLLSFLTLIQVFSLNVPSFATLGLWIFLILIGLGLRIYFIALILVVIFSWVRPQGSQSIMEISGQLVKPMLKPMQRFIPPLGGLDFSPMVLFFVIYLLQNVWRAIAISSGLPFHLVLGV